MNQYTLADVKSKLKAVAAYISASIAIHSAFGYIPEGIGEAIDLARSFRDQAKQDDDAKEMLERCESLFKAATRVAA